MKTFYRLLAFTIFLFFVSPSFAQPPPIRFAWLSDTHVGSTTGASELRQAVHDIHAMDDIDFIILSGDITEMGKTSDLELGKAIDIYSNHPILIAPKKCERSLL